MWQPISTAPKDGTWILLFEKDEKWRLDSDRDPPIIVAHWIYNNYRKRGEWREAGTEPWGVEDATHWMPLPVPPAT